MGTRGEKGLSDLFKIEAPVISVPQCEVSKAYSTVDGKEVLYHVIHIGEWKQEVIDCFMNALQIVQTYSPKLLFLECFGAEINEDNFTIEYVSESLTENIKSVYMGIGSVRLALLRKWLQDILLGLQDIHTETDKHPAIIHGRIRLQHLLYFRSTGQVRLGGYYWLTEVHPDTPYPQVEWAEEDNYIGYYPEEVFVDKCWSTGVDIYALGMSVIHMLSGCQPYGELDDNVFIKSAIINHKPPKGLLCIKEIDMALYNFLELCLAPYDKRPSAEELLKHEFFTNDNNCEIQLNIERVTAHPNNQNLSEQRFSKAFLRKIAAPRAPVHGIRYEHSPVSITPLQTEPKKEPVEPEPAVPESPIPAETSTNQTSMESSQNVEIAHIPIPKKSISPINVEDSFNRSVSIRTPLLIKQPSSLITYNYSLVVSHITVVMKVKASLLSLSSSNHFVQIKQNVDLYDTALPWSAVKELIIRCNTIRSKCHKQPLNQEEQAIIQSTFCNSFIQALKSIKLQFSENGDITYHSLFNHLRSLSQSFYITCLIPAHFFNDDPNCDFAMSVRFPISNKVNCISEAIQVTNDALESAVRDIRKKNNLTDLDTKRKEILRNEIGTVLEIKCLQMIKTDLENDTLSSFDKITVTVTHYQSPIKASYGNSMTISKTQSQPSNEIHPSISSIFNSNETTTVVNLPRVSTSKSMSAATSLTFPKGSFFNSNDDFIPYHNEVLSSSSKVILHITIPFSSSTHIIKTATLQFDCYYDLRKCKQTQEIVASIINWLYSIHIAIAEDPVLMQQDLTNAINTTINRIKLLPNEDSTKVLRKNKENFCVELAVTMNDDTGYTVNVIMHARQESSDNTFSTSLHFSFAQSVDEVVNEMFKDIINVSVDIKEDDYACLKEQLRIDLERELKRVQKS